ncbi:MAG: hypothetical protein JWQ90_265 [Hydrocarboniphaga sp.]|uniref:PIN domain-containing protein n=1 Tax=Hydrocarboniphaga sp. TaxID=2033016 RepID=UPI0026184B90|nr:PIN domain-containing protein [Hydrocarboniphaga sp.]MDB5967815.1 hypothetical protein [Hydrocarboniphaga sp.]
MSRRAFADSNVLLYTLSPEAKAAVARTALARSHVLSVQVLNEFANVVRRKKLLSPAEVREIELQLRQTLEIMPITLDLHESALDVSERYGFSFYDSLIVASALQSGCDTLYTEDLQHGQLIDKQLQVVNPFA